jgi:sugar-specific transcriptional regulator TrmB
VSRPRGEPAAEWNELVASLGRFGLSEREALLYLASLRRGRATARELTRDVGLDRVLGYRILDGLRARGVVEVTAERPRRFAPVDPRALVERDLRGRRATLANDERLGMGLAEALATAAAPAAAGAPRYQVLAGEGRVYDGLREMVERARERIDVMLTFRSLRSSLAHDLQGRVADFLRRGGHVRLLLEDDPRLRPTLARFRRSLRGNRRAEIRLLDPQPGRLTVVDGGEAVVFLVAAAPDRRVEEVAVWTDNPEFVSAQSQHFERSWAAARRVLPSGTGAGRSSARLSDGGMAPSALAVRGSGR